MCCVERYFLKYIFIYSLKILNTVFGLYSLPSTFFQVMFPLSLRTKDHEVQSALADHSWTWGLCWSIADKHCHCIVESNFPSPVGVRSNSSLVKGVLCSHSLLLMLGSAWLELVRVLCVCLNFLKSPPPLALTAFLLLFCIDHWALWERLYAT